VELHYRTYSTLPEMLGLTDMPISQISETFLADKRYCADRYHNSPLMAYRISRFDTVAVSVRRVEDITEALGEPG
jgi:hypothetical protein